MQPALCTQTMQSMLTAAACGTSLQHALATTPQHVPLPADALLTLATCTQRPHGAALQLLPQDGPTALALLRHETEGQSLLLKAIAQAQCGHGTAAFATLDEAIATCDDGTRCWATLLQWRWDPTPPRVAALEALTTHTAPYAPLAWLQLGDWAAKTSATQSAATAVHAYGMALAGGCPPWGATRGVLAMLHALAGAVGGARCNAPPAAGAALLEAVGRVPLDLWREWLPQLLSVAAADDRRNGLAVGLLCSLAQADPTRVAYAALARQQHESPHQRACPCSVCLYS